jgi:probable phosphoglycerate mutase
MSVDIFVARHGQNEDNINGILGGHRDRPLTDIGRGQARDLGQSIADIGLMFDTVYCSPLVRAHETADIVTETAGLPKPIVMPELIERDMGVMTGKPFKQVIAESEPDNLFVTDVVTYFLDAEGAETFDTLIVRAQSIIDMIHARHSTGRVLLVCHGDIGKMLYAASTGKDWREAIEDFHFGNAELIDLSGNGDVHTITFEQFNH